MKTTRQTRYFSLITTFFLIFLPLFTSGCTKRPESSPFGIFFPVPPGVSTIQGEDPYGSQFVPPVADIYWSTTISERGYALNRNLQLDPPQEFHHFFTAFTLARGVNYRPRYWMLRPDTRRFLKWTEVEQLNPYHQSFWNLGGNLEHGIGPLTMLYDYDLIDVNNLTIVVTDLEEQDLNMSLLADLIRSKLLKTDDYAAGVIALKLPYNGDNWKPSLGGRRMEITRHHGLKPLYVIVSGPKDAVTLYLRRFRDEAAKFNIDYHVVTTTQRGAIPPIAMTDARIPNSAIRSEFSRVVQSNRNIIRRTVRNPKMDIWNIRSGRGDYNGLDRIWNLQNRTDSMVNHFGLAIDNQLSRISERLGVFIFQYKTETPKPGKDGDHLWQLNINFDLPSGCDITELSAQIRNYRYLTSSTQFEDDIGLLPQWWQNDVLISRDFDIGQPVLMSDTNTVHVYVAPKDIERGVLESAVVCFDLIVRIRKQIEIPDWVNNFDDTTGQIQDRTWNFKSFINNLLKGDSATGIVYSDDELIRIPILLFDMPFTTNTTTRRR
jgi:hypothetical protein